MVRSRFVASAGALVAAAFLRDTSFAAGRAPRGDAFAPLIDTVLPLRRFAAQGITAERMTDRIRTLFDFVDRPAFAASLAEFSDVAAFASPSNALLAYERAARSNAEVVADVASDARRFDDASLPRTEFATLSRAQRVAYVDLWMRSRLVVRRRFAFAVRAVSFEALYSLPQTWSALGYAGPLRNRKR